MTKEAASVDLWKVRRWLICLLAFRGRHRTVMTPNRYTELFFLDEATGLAAGHVPASSASDEDTTNSVPPGQSETMHDQSTRPLTAGRDR